MHPHQDRSRLFTRVSTVVGIGALVTVAMAARTQSTSQTVPPPVPPAPTAMPSADSTGVVLNQDTLPVDSSILADSVAMSDSAALASAPAVIAPAPQPSGEWPVDPVTGQTLINGEPVVGRVFIMQKPDGLVKLGTWQAQYNGEPKTPAPANVASSYTIPAPEQTRRIRGIMVQSTLWSMDGKRSARERRYYRPQTTGAALGQQ
jgi:hypothetical protein